MDAQLVRIGLVGFGLVIAFAGLALFRKALTAFGAVLGGVAGFGVAAAFLDGRVLTIALGVGVGAVLGIVFIHTLYRFVVVTPGFLIGVAVGLSIDGPTIVIFALGVIGAALAWYVETIAVVLATSIGGGMIVSAALTTGTPITPLTLFDARFVTLWTGVVAVAGVAVQYGVVEPFSDDAAESRAGDDARLVG